MSDDLDKRYTDPEPEDEDYEEDEVRQCDETCGHYDSLNQCCWVASDRGLCTDVSEGDRCLYRFKTPR